MTAPQLDEAREADVLHEWMVPGIKGQPQVRISAAAGRSTTIVGPNGAGKSALGLWLDQSIAVSPLVHRLIAHRRLWFQHAGPEMSPAQRETTGSNLTSWSRRADSRYLDYAEGLRANVALFDILAKANYENELRVEMFETGASPDAVAARFGPPPLKRLNAIFRAAGLAIELKLTPQQTLNAVSSRSTSEYPIFHMSDGEKSALLLAAEVLTIAQGTVCIIDEPERHMHRSISAALVKAIVAERPDCHFIVLTHDLELAASMDDGSGQVYLLNGCTWSSGAADGWELLRVDPGAGMPESARAAILGGRRELLFMEGEKGSLDERLYELLFPGWTLLPMGSCEQVIRAVGGLRASTSHHWLTVNGIVDGDGRTEEEKFSLSTYGILTLPVNEIENLLYSAVVIKALATRQAESLGRTAQTLIDQARTAALAALREPGVSERLAADVALKVSRRRFLEQLPTAVDPNASSVTVTVPSPYPVILSEVTLLLSAGDLDGLARLVPVRNTGLRGQVAKTLLFRNVDDYEAAACERIRRDSVLAKEVRLLVGPLP